LRTRSLIHLYLEKVEIKEHTRQIYALPKVIIESRISKGNSFTVLLLGGKDWKNKDEMPKEILLV
jgi:hypothetical protein